MSKSYYINFIDNYFIRDILFLRHNYSLQ